jgi:transcriptional regulator with XRE-family HTH domain
VTSRFGALLQGLRRQAGLTQEELADLSLVSVRTLRRLESEEPRDVRTGTLRRVADALAGPLRRTPQDVLKELQDAYHGLQTSEGEVGETAPAEPGGNAEAGGGPPSVPDVVPPAPVLPWYWRPLSEAIEALAREVRAGWRREEDQRRINDPFPLPVQWRSQESAADHRANILVAPPGAAPKPLLLDGDLRVIARAYRDIPSRRLVVLGRAGSGKTILTLRFVLDYLENRAADEPVPVIFSLGDWDPVSTGLDDWLVHRLLRDFPSLAASAPDGSTLAAALVEAECVLPVLDGFDEISVGLHSAALKALNARPARPLLVTSRSEEFRVAAADLGILTRAAVLELTDLSREALADYLPRTASPTASDEQDGGFTTVWDPVFDRLNENPADPASVNLAAVLATPLMVALARTVYSDARSDNPVALLDSARFPATAELEDHLLSGFVPTVYHRASPRPPGPARPRRTRGWDPRQAEKYLGYLARHLGRDTEHDRRDLAWWQLAATVRTSSRILAVVLACMLINDVSDWLVSVPLDLAEGHGGAFALRMCLAESVLVGPPVGLAFGLVYGFTIVFRKAALEPSRLQLRLPGRSRRAGGGRTRRFTTMFFIGLSGGMTLGLGYGPAQTLEWEWLTNATPLHTAAIEGTLINVLVFGLTFGLAGGLVFGLVAVLETPLDIGTAATPVSLLATNRTTVLRQILALIPLLTVAIAFSGVFWVALLQGLLGPLSWPLVASGLTIGLVGGLTGTFAYALSFTAWGQWLLLTRIWLPLTGRLPWTPVAFLEDAYSRGVLRQAGAVYQFRHARLQEHLGRDTESSRARRSG